MSKSYEQGLQDGLAMFGRVCSAQSSCEDCIVATLRGDGMTCQEFMLKFPGKMSSILQEMDHEVYTYFNEFVTRFPHCGRNIEDVANFVCRRAIFEGYAGCSGEECVACWSQQYVQDETEEDSEGLA